MDLDDKYSILDMLANDTWLSYFIEINSTLLRIDGRYNHLGILSYFAINNVSTDSSFLISLFEGEALFSMVNIVEGTIPDYVGIEENQTYEYGVYYFEENANEFGIGIMGANNYTKRRKLTIEYVDGENPHLNSSCVLTDNFYMDLQDNWHQEKENYNLIPQGVHYLLRNLSKNPYSFSYLSSYFVSKDTNWDNFGEVFQQLFGIEERSFNFSTFENGYSISIPQNGGNLVQNFTYTANGVLNISIVSFNGTEIYSQRLDDFRLYHIECKLSSVIVIEMFGGIFPKLTPAIGVFIIIIGGVSYGSGI
jgi:hypothetical protein